MFLKDIAYSLISIKARRAGVGIGKRVKISAGGRYFIHPTSSITLSDGVWLGPHHEIIAGENSHIFIGPDVHFGRDARLNAGPGGCIHIERDCTFNHDVSLVALEKISIGTDTITGPYCYLSDNNHGLAKAALIRTQPGEWEPLMIGSDVWLGVGATILKGARVGDGAVVAVRAVVNKPVPDYEIWGGIPAKRIGERK